MTEKDAEIRDLRARLQGVTALLISRIKSEAPEDWVEEGNGQVPSRRNLRVLAPSGKA
ncbi:MAG: hypothetical protein AAB360_02165 [Patescibacteria group bacterium]